MTNKLLKNVNNYIDKKIKGIYGDVLILSFADYDLNSLKQLAGSTTSKLDNGITFILNVKNSSINFILKASETLKDKIDCSSIIKEVSKIAGGSGGGSKIFAQGGGIFADKKDEIIEYVKKKIVKE